MSELDERMQAVGALRDAAKPMVAALDPVEMPKGTKHQMVRSALLVAAPFLKGSVKELRGVPDEVIAAGVDEAIGAAVTLIRAGVGAIADAFGGKD